MRSRGLPTSPTRAARIEAPEFMVLAPPDAATPPAPGVEAGDAVTLVSLPVPIDATPPLA